MSRVIGRVALLPEVRRRLGQGVSSAPAEQSVPYAALPDLLDQLPLAPADLPAPTRGPVGRLVGTPVTEGCGYGDRCRCCSTRRTGSSHPVR